MPNYVSVLQHHEKELIAVLGALGIAAGTALTVANRDKIKAALKAKNIPHDTHDDARNIPDDRVYVG